MTTINRAAVAKNIKLVRSLLNLSMNEFGKKFGVTKDQVAAYENERSIPPQPLIIKVCELCGITTNDFITKPITKEEIVKEMFVILNNPTEKQTGNATELIELRKVIETLKQTIETQTRVIETQGKMMEQFSSLARR